VGPVGGEPVTYDLDYSGEEGQATARPLPAVPTAQAEPRTLPAFAQPIVAGNDQDGPGGPPDPRGQFAGSGGLPDPRGQFAGPGGLPDARGQFDGPGGPPDSRGQFAAGPGGLPDPRGQFVTEPGGVVPPVGPVGGEPVPGGLPDSRGQFDGPGGLPDPRGQFAGSGGLPDSGGQFATGVPLPEPNGVGVGPVADAAVQYGATSAQASVAGADGGFFADPDGGAAGQAGSFGVPDPSPYTDTPSEAPGEAGLATAAEDDDDGSQQHDQTHNTGIAGGMPMMAGAGATAAAEQARAASQWRTTGDLFDDVADAQVRGVFGEGSSR
jgi:hypothetical protein